MTPTGTDQDPDNLTRKQRRDHAREQRRVQEQERASAEARRRRRMQLGVVAGAVVVAIVVIVIATSGSKSSTEPSVPKTQSAKNEDVKIVESLLNGIPQKGVTLGDPKAPVTLQYFGDLECPICRQFTLGALAGVILDEVRKGKLKLEYRSLQTATREPSTFHSQQIAAYAAGKQNRAWYYIELFYHEQGAEGSNYVNENFLQGLAQQVPGLKLSRWQSDRGDKALEAKVLADEKAAREIGFTGTPSFMLGKSGSTLKPFTEGGNLESPSPFESAINKLA
jgi:protein-disulfide isomerase